MSWRLVTELMETCSLQKFVTMVEYEVSRYPSQKEGYGERVGNSLRESGEKYGGEEWFKWLSMGEKLPKGRAKAKKKKGGEPEELAPPSRASASPPASKYRRSSCSRPY